MGRTRRKSCCICGDLFWPDPRVGRRQRACSKRECQQERRRQTQAAWRAEHPDYFSERRLRQRAMRAEAAEKAQASARSSGGTLASAAARRPPPLRVAKELRGLPWDLAQSEMGVFPVDFLAMTASRVLVVVQDQRSP